MLSHLVGLLQPAGYLAVEVGHLPDTEVMRVTGGRERLDLMETVAFDPAREDEVADEVRFARRNAGKAHPDLEDDARLLWDHVRRSADAHETSELME